jgi:phosphoglycolate phosphatase
LAPFLGTPLPKIFRTVRPDVSEAEIKHGMQVFRKHYEREGIHGNRLYPGVREMLREVRHVGGRAWIVTSKPEGHAVRVAGLLRIDTLVDGVIGAGLDEADTKTGLVSRALSAARVPASQAMMLGDRH